MTKDARLQLRDSALAARVDEMITRAARAGIKLTRSDILRAATEVWLERIEKEGRIVFELKPPAKK